MPGSGNSKRYPRQLNILASPNVYLQQGDRRFDASLLISAEGEIQGISKMVHIAPVPAFCEQDYYAPSDTGFRVYDTPHGKIGIVVCFGRHYPESVRTCVLRGAQVILIATANTTDEPGDLFEWELSAAAMQNGVYIAMCNRIGREGEVVFRGESMVVDADGAGVVKVGGAEDLVFATIDLNGVEAARRKRPYLSLRRPELYE
jgi:predicted amidohydrolase